MPVFPTSPTRKANSANAIILPTFAHVAMEFGSEGIGAGQFKDARSIAIDGDRMIYVGEYTGGRVQVFDPKGKFVTVWSIAKDNALLNLTADRKGNVYAVVPSHIYRHKGATGELLGEVDHETDDTPSIYYSDAFVALDGDLYAIGNDHLIVDITPDGKIKRTLNAMEKVGENVSFDRITVNGAGEIYAVDREKGVFKFSPEGRYINRFGGGAAGNVRGPGHLSSPRGVAVDGKGRVCVTDNFKAVQVFDGDGIYLDSFGDDLAFGIAINDQNEILACFRNRNCVRKYVLDKP